MKPFFLSIAFAIGVIGSGASLAQQPGVTENDGITSFDPAQAAAPAGGIDYVAAVSVTLPLAEGFSEQIASAELARALIADPNVRLIPQVGRPTTKVGSSGSGRVADVDLGQPDPPDEPDDGAAQAEFGTSNLPFSTSRADLEGLRINEEQPYSPAGKLFFVDGGRSFTCSGSMIDKGLLLTAAHCVTEFGDKRFFSDWSFAPGYRNGIAPFDEWGARRVYVMTTYFDGTDLCHSQARGVVCENDVAVIVIESKQNAAGVAEFAGDRTGWYGVGWNQTGFTSSGVSQITQLGYPGCLDDAAFMQRNDSLTNISPEFTGNSVFGSLMCGGSSGGPILINFGVRPNLTGTVAGSFPTPNVVIGVTSWGSTNNLVKRMGSSPFREGNIFRLITKACEDFPDACA
jgi:V8-like Glu-specific endopeptidase